MGLAFTVTCTTLRGVPIRPSGRSPDETRNPGDSRDSWGRVRLMFAHSTQNWWWTAHPAAH
ncbi:trp operon leader peptide [Streptomyces ficellus]|uniref:Trp operon leader peptide n=1 Tax=Streptomyces ficellus TaxID=1977088 RepID=A0A6I6FD32_9ACTN|nr:trp operon leader peptide [Streptomyces ficellus]